MAILRQCYSRAVTYTRLSYMVAQERKLQLQAQTQTRCITTTTRTGQPQVKSQTSSTRHWYRQLLPDWKTQEQALEELSKSVVYEDDHILALNKPNGLPMHALKLDGVYLPRDVHMGAEVSVATVKEALERKLNTPNLVEVYSQPRLYSGIILFTKSEEAFKRLKKYFVHARTNKVFCQKFWGVTLGIPKVLEGQEQVALSRFHNDDRLLSVREKGASLTARQRRLMIQPDVHFKVLSGSHQFNASLLQLSPTATKWDCLEVYLVSKMCPLLGDHIYSSRLKTVMGQPVLVSPKSVKPHIQVLTKAVANCLDLTSNDHQFVPLHIHCQELTVPNLSSNRKENLTITAPVPDFFNRTLHCLQLTHVS